MAPTTKGAVRRDVDTGTDRDALLYDFGVDSPVLGSDHTKYLDELILFLEVPGRPPMTVSMDGFASRTGTAAHNQTLSENREQAVENYLRAHTTVFNPGNPHTLNRKFNGFTGSPPGENPLFRSVRVVVHKPGVVPPPVPVVPTPTAATVGKFEIDLIGWIPQPEVDNPLSLLPGAITSLLPPGMADPFFGGDNFTTPATAPSAMVPPSHTFRATQHIDFTISTWGLAPVVGAVATTPGTTTCLNNLLAWLTPVAIILVMVLGGMAMANRIAQVSNTYGQGEAHTIVENCGNTLILRCSSSEGGGTARFASQLIGEREVLRTTVSRSRRLTEALGSVSRTQHLGIEPAVLPSQVEQLPDLSGYLKFASDPTWTRVRLDATETWKAARAVPAAVPATDERRRARRGAERE